jgi:hypothetical protein
MHASCVLEVINSENAHKYWSLISANQISVVQGVVHFGGMDMLSTEYNNCCTFQLLANHFLPLWFWVDVIGWFGHHTWFFWGICTTFVVHSVVRNGSKYHQQIQQLLYELP